MQRERCIVSNPQADLATPLSKKKAEHVDLNPEPNNKVVL
jgi:hypothetical protein